MSRNAWLAALFALPLLAVPLAADAAPPPSPSAPSTASGPIDPGRMSETARVLGSDAFEGRAPGTPGEAKTVAWLINRFTVMGLTPGGENGGWTQAVPLVHTRLGAPKRFSIVGAGADIPLRQGVDAYVFTARPADAVKLAGAPLVFVGYGVAAPERGWDDFKGVDLKGKVAVVLVNDPDFEAAPGEPVAGRFGGKAMTYYGRWTYKYEEAARRGAAGVLIVHDTAGAGYPWSVVTAPQAEAYDIVRPAAAVQALPVQGWIQQDVAADLFRRAGLDLAVQKVAARGADFHPVALGKARLRVEAPVTHDIVESHNVLAKIPGATAPDQTVMFAAHWDAYGIGAPDASGRTIRSGANDDGMGVAGVLEIARAFANAPPPARTVVFALWTAEERGLLGSETYAVHPLYPPETVAANLTLDILNTVGPSRDVVLIGAGQDSLEDDLAAAAARQHRAVTPDSRPERGLFYRADHFPLAKRGVPTLLLMAVGGGPDLVDGGREAGDRWVSDYTDHCYHKTCDVWSAEWDVRGAAQDVDLFYEVGRDLANSNRWPTWNAGSEFKTVRDASGTLRR